METRGTGASPHGIPGLCNHQFSYPIQFWSRCCAPSSISLLLFSHLLHPAGLSRLFLLFQPPHGLVAPSAATSVARLPSSSNVPPRLRVPSPRPPLFPLLPVSSSSRDRRDAASHAPPVRPGVIARRSAFLRCFRRDCDGRVDHPPATPPAANRTRAVRVPRRREYASRCSVGSDSWTRTREGYFSLRRRAPSRGAGWRSFATVRA